MNLSYWEKKTWIANTDFTVIGSGIVGLSCAIKLRELYPRAKILVLEKGILPQGASTKNAGFACFGSLSEILDDLKSHSREDVLSLILKRYKGISQIRAFLGDESIGYKQLGGYELFLKDGIENYLACKSALDNVNKMLQPHFNKPVFNIVPNKFQFKAVSHDLVYNSFEGQIDTGKMMDCLLRKAIASEIRILNNVEVQGYENHNNGVKVICDTFNLNTKNLLIATNGYASKLKISSVKPARAQVLITKPIKNLKVRGTFHINKGYYYFRNIDDRILFGGGRDLDFNAENTTDFGLTEIVQNKLEHILRTVILPNNEFEIDHRWSGIMGVGPDKQPIVEAVSKNVYCGVKLGGMGIAIGTVIGRELAEIAYYEA